MNIVLRIILKIRQKFYGGSQNEREKELIKQK
jgi:hypothetical protein